jgi:hypothetical protein
MKVENERCNVQQQTGEPIPLAGRLGQLSQTFGFCYAASNKTTDFVQSGI